MERREEDKNRLGMGENEREMEGDTRGRGGEMLGRKTGGGEVTGGGLGREKEDSGERERREGRDGGGLEGKGGLRAFDHLRKDGKRM